MADRPRVCLIVTNIMAIGVYQWHGRSPRPCRHDQRTAGPSHSDQHHGDWCLPVARSVAPTVSPWPTDRGSVSWWPTSWRLVFTSETVGSHDRVAMTNGPRVCLIATNVMSIGVYQWHGRSPRPCRH